MLQRVRHGRPSLVSAAIHSVCWMMYGTPSVASSAKSGCVGGNCTSLIFLFCCVPWRLHRLFDIASSGLRPSFVIHFFKFFFFFAVLYARGSRTEAHVQPSCWLGCAVFVSRPTRLLLCFFLLLFAFSKRCRGGAACVIAYEQFDPSVF